jgi:hypothetical protein
MSFQADIASSVFAFDVIGELTWSKRIGFVERDHDVDGIVKFIGDFLSYCGPVGQQPFLDLIFKKNPILLQLQKWGISNYVFPVTRFAQQQSAARAAEMEKIKQDGALNEESGRAVDLLMKCVPSIEVIGRLADCRSQVHAGTT